MDERRALGKSAVFVVLPSYIDTEGIAETAS